MSGLSPTVQIYGTRPHGGEELRHEGPLPWKAARLYPVTVVIPSIPPRLHLLNRGLRAIQNQDMQPERVIVYLDTNGDGAAVNRNRALQLVPETSEAVTFIDDDDYMGRHHLARCWAALEGQKVDYVYPWFTIAGPSVDPFQHLDWYMKPWRDDRPHQTTIVTMVRRELAQEVGFRPVDYDRYPRSTEEGYIFGEDYQFTLECLAKGAKIHAVLERTWFWVVTGHNTSGRGEAWQHARSVQVEVGDEGSDRVSGSEGGGA